MRNKATKKNMDLDLRRYGKMLYTKAEKSGGSDDGGDDGGSDDSGGGDSESSNIFFSPVGIQPTHIGIEIDDTHSFIEIKDFTLSADSDIAGGPLAYSKEGLISIGINENDLNNLEIVSIDEIFEDISGSKGLYGDYINNILDENYVLAYLTCNYDNCIMGRVINDDEIPIIYRLGDNLYGFSALRPIG